MEEKTGIQEQVEPNFPLFKGLAIMMGSVLALMIALIFPLGEALFYGFAYLAGNKEKKRSRSQI